MQTARRMCADRMEAAFTAATGREYIRLRVQAGKSQTKSQRPQTSSHIKLLSATIVAARCRVSDFQPFPGTLQNLPTSEGFVVQILLRPQSSEGIYRTCNRSLWSQAGNQWSEQDHVRYCR